MSPTILSPLLLADMCFSLMLCEDKRNVFMLAQVLPWSGRPHLLEMIAVELRGAAHSVLNYGKRKKALNVSVIKDKDRLWQRSRLKETKETR